jgi:hypothetical protein
MRALVDMRPAVVRDSPLSARRAQKGWGEGTVKSAKSKGQRLTGNATAYVKAIGAQNAEWHHFVAWTLLSSLLCT